jgi:tetratricopeptide (TPR) repeat protein
MKINSKIVLSQWVVGILMACIASVVCANPLEKMHNEGVAMAKKDLASEKEAKNKAVSYQLLAGSLDSLSRSQEALEAIEAGLKLVPSDTDLIFTKAKILFSLGRCDSALAEIEPLLDQALAKAKAQSGIAAAILASHKEGFLVSMYCHTVAGRFNQAAQSLMNFVDPFDPSSWQYRNCWYLALVELGASRIEVMDRAVQSAPRTGSHYTHVVDMLRGLIAPDEMLSKVRAMPMRNTSKQDALAEALFFAGVKERNAAKRLLELGQLAPYGNSEWSVAKVLFK